MQDLVGGNADQRACIGVVVSSEKQPVLLQQELQQEFSAFSRIAARRDAAADESDEDCGDFSADIFLNGNGPDDVVQHEIMEEISTFDKVTVWEHEVLPDAQEQFTRGVEEWLAFAKTIHNTDL